MVSFRKFFASGLVLAARFRTRFLPRLSRRYAQNYERTRQGARWSAETAAFRALFRRVNPRSVLDCPVGTGRWFNIYRQRAVSVLGLDLSRDMLAEAAKKVWPGAQIVLGVVDLLAPAALSDLGVDCDLIVCTRFVYWLLPQQLLPFFSKLRATNAKYFIMNAKVTPEKLVPRERRFESLRTLFKKFAGSSHIFSEPVILDALDRAGWRLVEKRPVGSLRGNWIDVFYLLQRGEKAEARGEPPTEAGRAKDATSARRRRRHGR
jgi:SAM-dependent methyltransferase